MFFSEYRPLPRVSGYQEYSISSNNRPTEADLCRHLFRAAEVCQCCVLILGAKQQAAAPHVADSPVCVGVSLQSSGLNLVPRQGRQREKARQDRAVVASSSPSSPTAFVLGLLRGAIPMLVAASALLDWNWHFLHSSIRCDARPTTNNPGMSPRPLPASIFPPRLPPHTHPPTGRLPIHGTHQSSVAVTRTPPPHRRTTGRTATHTRQKTASASLGP